MIGGYGHVVVTLTCTRSLDPPVDLTPFVLLTVLKASLLRVGGLSDWVQGRGQTGLGVVTTMGL
ncbi:hypothetical protein BJ165DRAFT_1517753 [Panaeolus papilionaceus]|nr:hypothetical protein BJ165DRAFT_1517753 [Panaeolus papilionaceus]